ncbi:MAG: RNA methyltransferase, partial [Saccharospirillaceae bacterium]|nr:RNA methyltransferase [Saccharospirillaceae bacterium]
MLQNIKIVLIQTFHPGNIGAAARAMKNMGLTNLVLVNPVDFPSDEATSRAGQATDVLENATVVSSLEEAVKDCQLVIGTSARDRTITLPSLSSQQCGEKLVEEQQHGNVAVVFGRERMGLHNSDLVQCHFQLNIDANPIYPVLNISQAIQIVCYEVFKAGQKEYDNKLE